MSELVRVIIVGIADYSYSLFGAFLNETLSVAYLGLAEVILFLFGEFKAYRLLGQGLIGFLSRFKKAHDLPYPPAARAENHRQP